MTILYLQCPPLPHYMVSHTITFQEVDNQLGQIQNGVFHLIVVTKGAIHIREANNKEWKVNAGEYVILRPQSKYFFHQLAPSTTNLFWVQFNTIGGWQWETEPSPFNSWNSQNYQFEIVLHQYKKISSAEVIYDMLTELGILEQQSIVLNKWKQQLIFQDILIELALSEQTTYPTTAHKVAELACSYLKQHYNENFTNQKLSLAINFHEAYINRCMKKIYGMTALEFVNQYRIYIAKLLLLNSSLTINEIAQEVGFTNTTYFIRKFKKIVKSTPSSFRKNTLVDSRNKWLFKN